MLSHQSRTNARLTPDYKQERDDSFELLILQERRIEVLKTRIKDLEEQKEYLVKRFTKYWGNIEMRD